MQRSDKRMQDCAGVAAWLLTCTHTVTPQPAVSGCKPESQHSTLPGVHRIPMHAKFHFVQDMLSPEMDQQLFSADASPHRWRGSRVCVSPCAQPAAASSSLCASRTNSQHCCKQSMGTATSTAITTTHPRPIQPHCALLSQGRTHLHVASLCCCVPDVLAVL